MNPSINIFSSKCTLFYSSAFWRAFLTTGNTYMFHGPGGVGHIKLQWMTTLHVEVENSTGELVARLQVLLWVFLYTI